jgi:hypothetical protein
MNDLNNANTDTTNVVPNDDLHQQIQPMFETASTSNISTRSITQHIPYTGGTPDALSDAQSNDAVAPSTSAVLNTSLQPLPPPIKGRPYKRAPRIIFAGNSDNIFSNYEQNDTCIV